MLKRIIAVIICVCAAVGCAGAGITYYNMTKEKASLERQIADVKNEISAKEAGNAAVRMEVLSVAGGIDERRMNEDADYIREVLETAFTWSSFAEYNAMRAKLVDEYGFDPECQFLTDVFGEMPVSDIDPDYNYIDAHGLAIEFANCKLYCIGVTGANYDYFGELRWRSLGQGGGSADITYGFTLTTDIDGHIRDLFVMDSFE